MTMINKETETAAGVNTDAWPQPGVRADVDPSLGGYTQADLDDEMARRVVATRAAMDILKEGRGRAAGGLVVTSYTQISADEVLSLARFILYGE